MDEILDGVKPQLGQGVSAVDTDTRPTGGALRFFCMRDAGNNNTPGVSRGVFFWTQQELPAVSAQTLPVGALIRAVEGLDGAYDLAANIPGAC